MATIPDGPDPAHFGPDGASLESAGLGDGEADLRQAVQDVVASACRLTGAQHGVLLVAESEWNVLNVVSYGLTPEQREAIDGLTDLRHFLSRLLEANQAAGVGDDGDQPGDSALRPRITSLLAVPVHLREAPYGHLYLANKQGGQEFGMADEQLAVTLAKAAANSIENIRLLRQQYRRQQWLEGTSQMTRATLSEVDLPTATQWASERIREISGADYAAITLTDSADPTSLVFLAGSGLEFRPKRGDRIPRQGIVGMVVDSGRAIVTEDLTTDPRYDPTPERRRHLAVLGLAMFMPLNADEEVLGNLLVGWRRGSPQARLAAREVDLVQTFANQTALTLQRVRAQEDQRRRERWLEAASQMAQLLLGEVDRDEAMRLVIRQLREISGADIAGVMLVDENDADSMYAVVFEGIGGDEMPPDVRIPREGLLERVLADGKRIVSDDYTHLPGHQPPPIWAANISRVGLGMQVPLVADGQALGTVFAGWDRGSPHARTARAEAEQIQTFADLAALALQRVRTQGDREHLMLLEERDRIAHEMRDLVIQRLFGVGLRLRTAGDMSSEPAVQQRIHGAIKELDTTSRQIRSTIFGISDDEADPSD
ncbi:GAF domain-containing protein [Actinopolymorpha pittospori]